MKKIYFLLLIIILTIKQNTAQIPQGFKYQASIRDNNGITLLNKLVAIKISLLAGTANGTSIYSEVHNMVTSDFGIVNLNIGNGTVSSGNFSTIDWGSNAYFIKTEVDVNNGTNFLFMGTSQLLSVPYAMFAAKSGNAANDKDQDSLNELQNINLNGNNLQLNKNGGSVDLTKYDKDSQQLVLNGNTLEITRGNFVKLNDVDSTNELQQLYLNNNNLQLNKNGGNVDLTKYDKDSQQLVLIGNTLSITKGNSIVLSGAVDLDADPTNEIQNLSLSKDTLKLSKANFIVLPKEIDADSTNEIQSLSVTNDSLQLSKSNKIAFPKNLDNDSLNEIQQIQQTGNSLALTKNGGTVSVPSLTNVQNGSILYATASGINNFILNLPNIPVSYITGMTINFKVPNSNTGHVTVNVNNLGVKPLFKNVSDTMQSDDLLQNKMLSIIYDGQKFQLLNQLNNGYSKLDIAHFTFDTTASTSLSVISTRSINWTKPIGFNRTKIIKGNSISRIGDTIILQPGTYKINSYMPLVTINNPAFFNIRLFNVTQNTPAILGNGLSKNGGYTWVNLAGYIDVSIQTYFVIQTFTDIGMSNSYDSVIKLNSEPIINNSLNYNSELTFNSILIERVR